MALQVRRGTNAERLGITPLVGELIYVTDTKQLFIGDGATVGGTTSIAGTIDSLLADTSPQLGGELDLNGQNITGTGNINITGTITASGNINLGDGVGSDVLVIGGAIQGHLVPDTDITWNLGSESNHFNEAWISQLNVENQLTVGRIMGDIIADDSTIVFDSSTGLVAAGQIAGTLPAGVIPAAMTSNITGNLTGNATGAHSGTLDGDVTGSVFTDDSTAIVDGVNNLINTSKITTAGLENLVIQSDLAATKTVAKVLSLDEQSELRVVRSSATDLSASTASIGTISFGVEDTNGISTSAIVLANKDSLYLMTDPAGNFDTGSLSVTLTNGNLAVGSFAAATEKLEVYGNTTVSGFVQFGSLTTTQRNALTAANGMVIYNSTDNKFQGYEDGGWANLI